MYATANDGKVVDGGPRLGGTITCNVPSSPYYNQTNATFVGTPEDENGNQNLSSYENEIRGFESGGLWDYYEDYKLMHCPSDRRYHSTSKLGGSGRWGGYRSYSIGAVYSFAPIEYTIWKGSGEFYHMTFKRNRITKPSDKFIWIEEADGYGYNENTFNMWIEFGGTIPPRPYTFWDPVAVWHNEASTFGYADGHADRYKWNDKELIRAGVIGDKEFPLDNMEDYEWFRDRYIPRR